MAVSWGRGAVSHLLPPTTMRVMQALAPGGMRHLGYNRCQEFTACMETLRSYENRLICERGEALSQSGQICWVSRVCDGDKGISEEASVAGPDSSANAKDGTELRAGRPVLTEFQASLSPFASPARTNSANGGFCFQIPVCLWGIGREARAIGHNK